MAAYFHSKSRKRWETKPQTNLTFNWLQTSAMLPEYWDRNVTPPFAKCCWQNYIATVCLLVALILLITQPQIWFPYLIFNNAIFTYHKPTTNNTEFKLSKRDVSQFNGLGRSGPLVEWSPLNQKFGSSISARYTLSLWPWVCDCCGGQEAVGATFSQAAEGYRGNVWPPGSVCGVNEWIML